MQREALIGATVQPGGRSPAPGALRLVQDFVNTVDRENGPDLLDDPGALREWLDVRGLAPGASIGAADVLAARDVREALRALLLANNGEPEEPGARVVLEEAGRRGRLEAVFGTPESQPLPRGGGLDGSPGPHLVARADGLDGALAAIVAAAFAAMLDGSWSRLKACPRDVCGWAFYDRSTNASATWCSMRVCGGRVKAGTYYRRRRAAAL